MSRKKYGFNMNNKWPSWSWGVSESRYVWLLYWHADDIHWQRPKTYWWEVCVRLYWGTEGQRRREATQAAKRLTVKPRRENNQNNRERESFARAQQCSDVGDGMWNTAHWPSSVLSPTHTPSVGVDISAFKSDYCVKKLSPRLVFHQTLVSI